MSNGFEKRRNIDTVDVSVIVPTFNRASSVQRLLASLNACVNSITAELLIVDNGSTDNTASVLAQATRECTKFSLRILREERRGKANALNRGLRSAQGKIFLIVDDDVVVHPQCLIQHAESYRVTSFDAMQGRVLPGVDVHGKTADPKRLREYNIPIIDYGREPRGSARTVSIRYASARQVSKSAIRRMLLFTTSSVERVTGVSIIAGLNT